MQEIYIYDVSSFLKVDYNCRNFCKIPYLYHPKGCPNYGKNDNCPPKAPLVRDVFDFDRELYFFTEEFNLSRHVQKMQKAHPQWSLRQCKNLLYWQGGVRKRLKEKTEEYIESSRGGLIYTLIPEAMGVMVIDTALKIGIPIERTPKNRIVKIALVGHPHPNALKKMLKS